MKLAPITHSISLDTAVGSEVGGPLAVTDPDMDTLTYAISSGNTDELFEIDDTGQLTTAAAVPAGTYELTVTVSDGKDSDDTADPAPDATITVTITAVENAAPVFDETGPIPRSIVAGGLGRTVGSPVTATDPEGDSLTYAITGGATTLFDIDTGTGQLTTKAAVTADTYSVTVTVHDGKGADGNAVHRS